VNKRGIARGIVKANVFKITKSIEENNQVSCDIFRSNISDDRLWVTWSNFIHHQKVEL
jgi:hypothetical protein